MELILKGWLCCGDNDMAAIKEKPDSYWTEDIARSIEDFVKSNDNNNTFQIEYEEGLGGTKTYIKNAQIYFYITDAPCTLEEAKESLIYKMFGGTYSQNVSLDGYSEYTITGYCLEECKIGNHDLDSILKSYTGKYINFVLKY